MPCSNRRSLSKNHSSISAKKISVAISTTGISDPTNMTTTAAGTKVTNKRLCSVVNDDDVNPNQKKRRITKKDDYKGTPKKCSKPTPRCLFQGKFKDDDENKGKRPDKSIDTDEEEKEEGDNDDDDDDDNDLKQKAVKVKPISVFVKQGRMGEHPATIVDPTVLLKIKNLGPTGWRLTDIPDNEFITIKWSIDARLPPERVISTSVVLQDDGDYGCGGTDSTSQNRRSRRTRIPSRRGAGGGTNTVSASTQNRHGTRRGGFAGGGCTNSTGKEGDDDDDGEQTAVDTEEKEEEDDDDGGRQKGCIGTIGTEEEEEEEGEDDDRKQRDRLGTVEQEEVGDNNDKGKQNTDNTDAASASTRTSRRGGGGGGVTNATSTSTRSSRRGGGDVGMNAASASTRSRRGTRDGGFAGKNKRKRKDNSVDTVDEEDEVGPDNKNDWKRQRQQMAFESDEEEEGDNDNDDDRKQKAVDTDEEEEEEKEGDKRNNNHIISDYEQNRKKKIKRNEQRMADLGLVGSFNSHNLGQEQIKTNKQEKKKKKKKEIMSTVYTPRTQYARSAKNKVNYGEEEAQPPSPSSLYTSSSASSVSSSSSSSMSSVSPEGLINTTRSTKTKQNAIPIAGVRRLVPKQPIKYEYLDLNKEDSSFTIGVLELSREEWVQNEKRIAHHLYETNFIMENTTESLITADDLKTEAPLTTAYSRLLFDSSFLSKKKEDHNDGSSNVESIAECMENGEGICVRFTTQSIKQEIRQIKNNSYTISQHAYAMVESSDTLPEQLEDFVLDDHLQKYVPLKYLQDWKMDNPIMVTCKMNSFDSSLVECLIQRLLQAKFSRKTYDEALIGTDDGLLMFNSNYKPPRNHGPTEVKKNAFVYVHTIKRKLCILGKKERNKYNTTWSKMYDQLVAYKQQHGDCNVNESGDNKKLGKWVARQRINFKNQVKGYQAGKSSDRYIELNKIGFVFDLDDQAWSTMYKKLVAYKQQHGDCNFKQTGDNKKLGTWVCEQRRSFKKQLNGYQAGKSSDRYIALTEIGFMFNPNDQAWWTMYEKLVAYEQEHGDCNVSQTGDNKKLGMWVSHQRTQFKNQVKGYQAGKSSDRYIELNKIGFVWNARQLINIHR